MTTFIKTDNFDLSNFLKNRDKSLPFLFCSCDKSGDGKTFRLSMIAANSDHMFYIDLPHENLDGFIYTLTDIKQSLELARQRNK